MFKTCPRCGDEFVEHVSVCPDCHVPLVAAGSAAADAARDPMPEAIAQLPSLEHPVLLRHGDTSELRQLAEALASAGIACAVDTDPPGESIRGGRPIARGAASKEIRLAIYVTADETRRAASVLAEWLTQSIPGAEHVSPAIAGGCPGCNELLPDDAIACPSCGLEFPPLEVACPQCGHAVAVEAESCARCGYRP